LTAACPQVQLLNITKSLPTLQARLWADLPRFRGQGNAGRFSGIGGWWAGPCAPIPESAVQALHPPAVCGSVRACATRSTHWGRRPAPGTSGSPCDAPSRAPRSPSLRSPASSSACFTQALRVPWAIPSSRAICARGRPQLSTSSCWLLPELPGIRGFAPRHRGLLPEAVASKAPLALPPRKTLLKIRNLHPRARTQPRCRLPGHAGVQVHSRRSCAAVPAGPVVGPTSPASRISR
jgi:hypothetical protein